MPTTSIEVVTTGPVAMAGSILIRLSAIGMSAPKLAARIMFPAIASITTIGSRTKYGEPVSVVQ